MQKRQLIITPGVMSDAEYVVPPSYVPKYILSRLPFHVPIEPERPPRLCALRATYALLDIKKERSTPQTYAKSASARALFLLSKLNEGKCSQHTSNFFAVEYPTKREPHTLKRQRKIIQNLAENKWK